MKIPVGEYQQAYFAELKKIQSLPQKRLDATYRYIEAIEDGKEDISSGILTEPPRKYYIDNEDEEFYNLSEKLKTISQNKQNSKDQAKNDNKKYNKPLYIRDKNNPNILHPYKEQ